MDTAEWNLKNMVRLLMDDFPVREKKNSRINLQKYEKMLQSHLWGDQLKSKRAVRKLPVLLRALWKALLKRRKRKEIRGCRINGLFP